MPKLKSLRGAVGTYGRVAAGGIVDVSEADAKKLLGTKRFVTATDADIAAARKRQEAELAVETVGATPGFSAMPTPPNTADRLSQMIERGQIDRQKAKELVALQINLSTEEVQSFIQSEADKVLAEISAEQSRLTAIEQALSDREDQLAKREADVDAREKALAEAKVKADAEAVQRRADGNAAKAQAEAEAANAKQAEEANAKASVEKKAAK